LENIYNLAKQGDYKLLVELEDWVGKKVYAEYSSFHLESESEAPLTHKPSFTQSGSASAKIILVNYAF